MPELPDITLYAEHLERRLRGARLESARVKSPNLLRTVDPPLKAAFGLGVRAVRRLGKRVVIELEAELHLVFHLMIAGRFQWRDVPGAGPAPAGGEAKPPPRPGKLVLATFAFSSGTLSLTEASTKQRASLHVVRGRDTLAALDPGGIEPLEATTLEFRRVLGRDNHTLKRALTDPRLVSGIGNAYSDEILHRARLSPMRQTRQLTDDEWLRLHDAVGRVLSEWTARLREACGEGFPTRVTAFRDGMAVHGRFRKPCPDCGAPVQRIVYVENEANYCARCQTGGRLLADRAWSRLLKGDWPRRIEELEGTG